MRVKDALNSSAAIEQLTMKGWVRTKRDAKGFTFLEINDGSCLKNIQIIVDEHIEGFDVMKQIHTGASVAVKGALVDSPGKGQRWEMRANGLELIGPADPASYPLQKKRHSDEFLRGIAHLRPRTNKYGAMFRIRSESSFAVHQFFHERGFVYVHTPIVTGSDCEGAGEMFRVTTLPPNVAASEDGQTIFEKDFFGKEANLTVSGQLDVESYACSLDRVYTFGPTFRAENSNTPRHASEFWMIEPEAAFADLDDNMALGEEMVRYLTGYIMEKCADDIELFAKFVDKSLMGVLTNIVESDFVRLPYREAIEILKKSGRKFDYPTEFGTDLQTEHERFLCETHFKKPVIIYNYPKSIKPFYMRINDDDETVAAMDVLVPKVGELIGGGQREERLDVLQQRMQALGMDDAPYWWYLDLRRFGTVPHSGFGLGFERFLMMVTGVANIRDVIPFPRTPKNLEF
ncbi:asparagine--tRNA ligase [candidate division KSB3 bacterium]|uniref:Asparagine--tRNA ligase n=1 Tax=candidate division KSB3 bacterium TaxID=2044937 RepID=A0A2G6E1Y3_9BACT|nr:MAG: asparagine--tRNA ligase [candidate division KSB3 bacterium]PIE28648.1 MAG: asparagine--tRNA ligase [candidate division KSB3 bacterium]